LFLRQRQLPKRQSASQQKQVQQQQISRQEAMTRTKRNPQDRRSNTLKRAAALTKGEDNSNKSRVQILQHGSAALASADAKKAAAKASRAKTELKRAERVAQTAATPEDQRKADEVVSQAKATAEEAERKSAKASAAAADKQAGGNDQDETKPSRLRIKTLKRAAALTKGEDNSNKSRVQILQHGSAALASADAKKAAAKASRAKTDLKRAERVAQTAATPEGQRKADEVVSQAKAKATAEEAERKSAKTTFNLQPSTIPDANEIAQQHKRIFTARTHSTEAANNHS